MEVPRIVAVGALIKPSAHVGYFELTCWFRTTCAAEIRTEVHDHLTWAELTDVMQLELDGRRPGFELLSDGWQPTLWSTAG